MELRRETGSFGELRVLGDGAHFGSDAIPAVLGAVG
jgi:hypothetical protein